MAPFQVLWHIFIIALYLAIFISAFFIRKFKNLKINFNLNKKDLIFTGKALIVLLFLLLLAGISGFLRFGLFNGNILYLIIGLIISVILIAPVEEILFRGIGINLFIKKFSKIGAVIISSLIFGLVHLPNEATGLSFLMWNWKLAAISFIGGLLFAITFLKTKSIINSAILHAITGIVCILFFVEGHILF